MMNLVKASLIFVLFLPLVISPPHQVKGVAGIATCDHLAGVGATAWYNWSPSGGPDCPGRIPMIRDAEQVAGLQDGTLQIPPGANLILGFNEPDLDPPPGSALTPEEAVPLWRWVEETYPDHRLVSPAPSPNDIYWLLRFRNAYRAEYGEWPRFDYLGAHCYFYRVGNYDSTFVCKGILRMFIAWADEWEIEGGVLLTEFAAGAIDSSTSDGFDYDSAVFAANNFLAWLLEPEQDRIMGWFWFSAHDWGVWPANVTTALYDDEEQLTPLGEVYRDFSVPEWTDM